MVSATSDAKKNQPARTVLTQHGIRKVHTTLPDGKELVEEYEVQTDDLVARKWRGKTMLGATTPWIYEVGDADALANQPTSSRTTEETNHIRVAAHHPALSRRDTRTHYTWRIRNLPYPKEVYNISVEESTLVVRTLNKKYFKKIEIQDLNRRKIKLDPANLFFDWGSDTLVISYKKPLSIVQFEEKELKEIKKLDSNVGTQSNSTDPGKVECNQS